MTEKATDKDKRSEPKVWGRPPREELRVTYFMGPRGHFRSRYAIVPVAGRDGGKQG
jgi:hypothetical protein